MNSNQKRLLVIAGPNGSGKSSLISETRLNMRQDRIINPDNYARMMPASVDVKNSYIFAMKVCEELRERLLDSGISFGFETVASKQDKLDFVKKAKEKGYYIDYIFVNAGSPEKCCERIRERVSMGGHDVPKEKVFLRYERTMKYLPEYLEIADHAILYDNGTDHLIIVASKNNGKVSVTADGRKCQWVREYLASFID